MNNKRRTGSFYTPKAVADFLVKYLSNKLGNKRSISILEPSAGDGVFVNSIIESRDLLSKTRKIVAIEKSKKELDKIPLRANLIDKIHNDFLDYQKDATETYTLVVGNPPYVKKGFLNKHQINLCKEIHTKASLSTNEPKNIWAAFLVRCVEFTHQEGILSMILPAELLQVKFAKELRTLLKSEFQRVEIFSFNELLFDDCQGQDTVLLVAERISNAPGLYYSNINKVADLLSNNFNLTQSVSAVESKWTHQHLTEDETSLLERLKNQIKTVDDYCLSKAGIVTAANNFFIVDQATVKEYSLYKHVRPIIQKGVFVNGSVILSSDEFEKLIIDSKPAFLLSLSEDSIRPGNKKIKQYLRIGVKEDIHKRFKTLLRNKWYSVPNVGVPPEAFFFKRCDEYPKLLKNSADVLVTDCAYKVTMRDKFDVDSLIYSFYNSLTLSFAELHGRYYGGGVLELTPNEFKGLPVPYTPTSSKDFLKFAAMFKQKQSIKDVCKQNDLKILQSISTNIDTDVANKLFGIREKLLMRRKKSE